MSDRPADETPAGYNRLHLASGAIFLVAVVLAADAWLSRPASVASPPDATTPPLGTGPAPAPPARGPARFSGSVKSAEPGAPAAFTVSVSHERDEWELSLIESCTFESRASGRFEFAFENPPGEVWAVVTAEGFAPALGRRVRLCANESVAEFRIDLERGCLVMGRVVDQGGTPVAGVSVAIEPRRLGAESTPERDECLAQSRAQRRFLRCDANGCFGFPHLPEGTFAVIAVAPGFATVVTRHFTVKPASSTMSLAAPIVMEPAGRVLGHVSTASTPGARFRVCATRLGDDGRAEPLLLRHWGNVRDDGSYDLPDLPPGQFRLEARLVGETPDGGSGRRESRPEATVTLAARQIASLDL